MKNLTAFEINTVTGTGGVCSNCTCICLNPDLYNTQVEIRDAIGGIVSCIRKEASPERLNDAVELAYYGGLGMPFDWSLNDSRHALQEFNKL